MKKTYIMPEVKAFMVQTEGSILFGSPNDKVKLYEDEDNVGASGALSTGWGSSSWTETDEDEL